MRDWTSWTKPLERGFKSLKCEAVAEVDNFERFVQIELGLWMLEQLRPGCRWEELPAWLTGYPLRQFANNSLARRMHAIARHRLRYLRTRSAWERWLRWYAERPAELRLYDVNLDEGTFQRRSGAIVISERLQAYETALTVTAPHRQRASLSAPVGQYTFRLNGEDVSVIIPKEIADVKWPEPPEEPPTLRRRPPITVKWVELQQSAAELDRLEPTENWLRRFDDLQFSMLKDDQLLAGDEFTLDDLFHLVGMVGSGKSTLIHVLIHYLVVTRGLHVSVVVNTVSESIAMAARLQKWGIAAAPAMGADRAAHRLKYGQAKSKQLMMQDILDVSSEPDPALDWLTAPCALSGLLTEGGPLPSGDEPCNSLERDGKSYICPLRRGCPVHQASHDLATSQVIIVNPASFIVTSAPENLSLSTMRLAELIYRLSDVLIIDEVDRFQVQADRRFTPVDNLAGQRDALLEWLNLVFAEALNQQGRRQVKDSRAKKITRDAWEANRHANQLIYLLSNNQDLAEWLGRYPMTNASICLQLADDLSKHTDDSEVDEALSQQLFQRFQEFLDNPISPDAGGLLAEIANDIRHEEYGEANMLRRLHEWLAEQLPYDLGTRQDATLLVRRLALAIILRAMDYRVDVLLRDWIWAAPKFDERRMLDQSPPEEYIDLVPENPLGNLLGYQYMARQDRTGALKFIQAYGVGRWLLHHFHTLYLDLDGVTGPHLFVTSATSWMPGSSQFHLDVTPHAILRAPQRELDAINQSTFEFLTVIDEEGRGIRVSGMQGQVRLSNIERLARYLAADNGGPSVLERELKYWADRGDPRKVLLLVGSYTEARAAVSALDEMPRWRNRVAALIPDSDDSLDSTLVRRGEVEALRNVRPDVDVLIAPLLAIERGFNILDEAGGALLGSAFFLTRPIPSPEDIGRHLLTVNAWAIRYLNVQGGTLPEIDGSNIQAIREMRHQAFQLWHSSLRRTYHGLESLSDQSYDELLASTFVITWQAIGRLVRKGRRARVFFVDSAFMPASGRSVLRGWRDMLAAYLDPTSNKPRAEQLLARVLYEPAYRAFKTMLEG